MIGRTERMVAGTSGKRWTDGVGGEDTVAERSASEKDGLMVRARHDEQILPVRSHQRSSKSAAKRPGSLRNAPAVMATPNRRKWDILHRDVEAGANWRPDNRRRRSLARLVRPWQVIGGVVNALLSRFPVRADSLMSNCPRRRANLRSASC